MKREHIMQNTILIVDDEKSILFGLKRLLEDSYSVTCCDNAEDALELLDNGNRYDLLIVDFKLQLMNGYDILDKAKSCLKTYKAFLITAYANKNVLETMLNQHLIERVIEKPYNADEIVSYVKDALKSLAENRAKEIEYQNIKNSMVVSLQKHKLVYKSEVIEEVLGKADKYAKTSEPVIINGESGVGKEVFASYIHENSNRSKGSYVTVNCGSFPDSLFEAEFFGTKKGSYTGSIKNTVGKFEAADKGTIFLDEISEFPLQQQVKLLRVIEYGEVFPLGADTPIKVDVKIICASNKSLDVLVEEGKFRKDLFFRLNVLSIEIPPLRKRKEDIGPLVSHFLNQIAFQEDGEQKWFSSDAIDYISTLEFNGNVRELRNLVFKSYILAKNSIITKDHLLENHEKKDSKDLFENTQSYKEFKCLVDKKFFLTQFKKHEYSYTETAAAIKMDLGNFSRKMRMLGIAK
jgi:DNA-binding NtrC family response regulator